MLEKLQKKITADIADHGQSVIGVFGEGKEMSFAYTIGNHVRGLPEMLIVAPMRHQDMMGLLNYAAATLAKKGPHQVADGELVDIGGTFPMKARKVGKLRARQIHDPGGSILAERALRRDPAALCATRTAATPTIPTATHAMPSSRCCRRTRPMGVYRIVMGNVWLEEVHRQLVFTGTQLAGRAARYGAVERELRPHGRQGQPDHAHGGRHGALEIDDFMTDEEDEDEDDDACENCGNTLNDGSDICDQCGGAFVSQPMKRRRRMIKIVSFRVQAPQAAEGSGGVRLPRSA